MIYGRILLKLCLKFEFIRLGLAIPPALKMPAEWRLIYKKWVLL